MQTSRFRDSAVPRRRAFTLLELLIVGTLTSVLMVGVWSMFRTWGRISERGERRVESAQLTRSLADQFADDVRAAAFVPATRLSRSTSSSKNASRSRRSRSSTGNLALVGGANWLVLDILQPPNPFALPSTDDEPLGPEEESQQLYAPELQRVFYTFLPPAVDELGSLSASVEEMAAMDDTEAVGSESETVEPFGGLLRVVMATEQCDQLVPTTGAGRRSSSAAASMSQVAWGLRDVLVGGGDMMAAVDAPSLSGTASFDDPLEAGPIPIGQDEVQEVIWMEFRYFNGSSWLSSWDSQSQGRLPVAVEMRFELQDEREDDDVFGESFDDDTELVDDGLTDSGSSLSDFMPAAEPGFEVTEELDEFGAEEMLGELNEETPYYRCVVFLNPK